MRYAQRGGYTPAEQQRREWLRMEAAGRFARGDAISQIAHDLRVTEGSVRRSLVDHFSLEVAGEGGHVAICNQRLRTFNLAWLR